MITNTHMITCYFCKKNRNPWLFSISHSNWKKRNTYGNTSLHPRSYSSCAGHQQTLNPDYVKMWKFSCLLSSSSNHVLTAEPILIKFSKQIETWIDTIHWRRKPTRALLLFYLFIRWCCVIRVEQILPKFISKNNIILF